MSVENARTFLDHWLSEHVHDVVCPEGNLEAKQLARLCLKEADDQGITKTELEEAAGEDLVNCIMDAQEATADVMDKDNDLGSP